MSYRNIATDDSVGQSMVIYMEATSMATFLKKTSFNLRDWERENFRWPIMRAVISLTK